MVVSVAGVWGREMAAPAAAAWAPVLKNCRLSLRRSYPIADSWKMLPCLAFRAVSFTSSPAVVSATRHNRGT